MTEARDQGGSSDAAPGAPGRRTEFTDRLRDCDDKMRALAYSVLGSHQAMDDVLQEAYLKAYRAYGSFREDSSFSTWLYTIVYRCCLDSRSRRNRRWLREIGHEPEAVDDPSAGFESAVSDRLDLITALRTLSVEHRVVLVLIDLEGLPLAEVARVLDVPRGTVASRVSRARNALRESLQAPQPYVQDRPHQSKSPPDPSPEEGPNP